ncbi:hypothetical protein EU528_02385 [Candidatus Thorarchaeota archaeon]|nr:MAG: hypothetical protein EU528_02385 [Candidatus Thorarchaeota archaeon]
MNREIQIVVVCIISFLMVSGVIVGILTLSSENPFTSTDPNHSLSWSVSVNDTLTYDMLYLTADIYGDSIEEEWESPNNISQQITAKIINLPQIPAHLDARSFVDDIYLSPKVSVIFSNASEFTSYQRSEIASCISKSIFPIGDWEFLDEIFGNPLEFTTPGGQYPNRYIYGGTIANSTFFEFDDTWRQQSSGHGSYRHSQWNVLEIERGISHSIKYFWIFSHVAGYQHGYAFTLLP